MNYLPWYNQNKIDFLEKNRTLLSNFNIFEYGCGFSTLYFSQFAKSVTSAELRAEWFEKISHLLLQNNLQADLHLVKYNFANCINEFFVSKINNQDNIFIIIDSNDRAKCLQICTQIANTHPNTIIMLDNSERENLQNEIQNTQNQGFHTKTFVGVRPVDGKTSTSTLFCKNQNWLGLIS